MRVFTDKLANADVALFFYAGHGLQVGLQNYLVPIDAKLERERDLEFETVKLEFVLRQMEIEREGKTTIVILDACRDNPLARNLARSMGTRSAGIGRGLAAASTGLGTFIAYSTQPGNVALDGQGRNSPFTAALIKHMGVKGHNLPATMIEVRKEVVAATGGAQVPWDHSALTGDFFFAPGAAAPSPGTVASAPAGTSADVAALQERLRKLEEEARRREAAASAVAPSTTGSGTAGDAKAGHRQGIARLSDRRECPHRRDEVQRPAPAEPGRLPGIVRAGCALRCLPARPSLADDGTVPALLAHRRAPRGRELAVGGAHRRCPAIRGGSAAALVNRLTTKIVAPLTPQGEGLRHLRGRRDHGRSDQDERDRLRAPAARPSAATRPAASPPPTTTSSAARTSPASSTATSPTPCGPRPRR